MIEDGAVGALIVMTQSIPYRENKLEFVYHILSCIRLLSESPGCRGELLMRGTIDMLQQLLQHAKPDARNQRLLIKSIYNLLQGTRMTSAAAEVCVNTVCTMTIISKDMMTLQYCAACLNHILSNGMTVSAASMTKIINALPILLDIHDVPITQYYAVATTGQVLFTTK
jgi:hypothetical protein